MAPFSRRTFLLQSSTSVLYAAALDTHALLANMLGRDIDTTSAPIMNNAMAWNRFGRLKMHQDGEMLTLRDGFLSSLQAWRDLDFSFTARAPKEAEEVQIWAGIRCRDRDSRYVFGLRGGNNDHLYFARYAPEGGIKFLGITPLDFHPSPGEWYNIRALARGNQFQLYLNQEKLPRLRAVDMEPLWHEGGVALGGGWLPAEFRNIRSTALLQGGAETFDAAGNRVYSFGNFDRAQRRMRQRAAYKGVHIASIASIRTEISLDGHWLILPDQELRGSEAPESISCDDAAWHVMEVPNFWTPTLTWLHRETGFPHLNGVSAGKGLSDKLYQAELDRLNGLTFSWKDTKSAWYRHHIELPPDVSGKHVELSFDAVAKACEVWVNGIRIGAHIGMFGEMRCDITAAVKPGANVLAVHVHGQLESDESSNAVLGIAVTVPVTASMLRSLPHGMYPDDAGGIWQPVRLVVTDPVAVEEVDLTPRLDGLTFEVKFRNPLPQPISVLIGYSIRSVGDNSLLHSAMPHPHVIAHGGASIEFTTPKISPKLWSPQEPNLYDLDIVISVDGRETDRHSTRFGFRTFRVEGNRLLLNDRPLWLRGANHFPHALRPNDKALARRFTRIAHDGNVQVTRSHTAPFTAAWLDAADEIGMGVSYEGTWPWLMLEGEPPDESLLHIWKEEYLSLIRKYRNHPSILFWTVNNEMKFEMFDRKDPDRLRKKWTILSDMVTSIRSTDPTRPIVCDSSYCRKEVGAEYDTMIRPEGFDDGDIDDAHRYYGWYNPSFFHLFNGEFGDNAAWPGRPLISQEMSTGYPRNDDGHPTRYYMFQDYTPQALVGAEAYENHDPDIFLRRQALMTKELAETLRRTNRNTCSGILHFAYVTWFRDVWDAEKIHPFATYHALRKALQPVLVSAELYGRHFYAGQNIPVRICIANDSQDGEDLPACKLAWEVHGNTESLAQGTVEIPAVSYYSNRWVTIVIQIPERLPASRIDASLTVSLVRDGAVLSSNDYDLTLATRAWAEEDLPTRIALLDPFHVASGILQGTRIQKISSMDEIGDKQQLVIAAADRVLGLTQVAEAVDGFVARGGRVLLLHPGARMPERYPELVRSYREHEGEIVDMRIPESMIFEGIEASDLCWFQREGKGVPTACTGSFQITQRPDAVALASTVDLHGYLKTPEDVTSVSGAPLIELRIGKGTILASEMFLASHTSDPIAGRLLSNMIRSLCHGSYPLTTP